MIHHNRELKQVTIWLARFSSTGLIAALSLLIHSQTAIANSSTSLHSPPRSTSHPLILAQTEPTDNSDSENPTLDNPDSADPASADPDSASDADAYEVFDGEEFNFEPASGIDDDEAEIDPALDEDAIEDAELGNEDESADTEASDDEESDDETADADEEPNRFEIRDQFFSNPLQDRPLDPLIPDAATSRPLDEAEQAELRGNLNQLHAQGVANYESGDLEAALPIWRRELRLWRLLPPIEEVQALDRVGLIVWDESKTTDVSLITERLRQIRSAELDPNETVDATIPVDFELLQAVGEAFATVRSYDDAVTSYEQIAVEARRRNEDNLQESALNTLAEIHLAWFKYSAAASVYQELMAFAQNRNDAASELDYLELLAKAYDRGDIYQQAITTQEQLAENFQTKSPEDVPVLKIAIAANHEALGQYEQAARAYQEAFTVAQTQQQYGLASDALNALADMYLSLDRPDDALYVYQLLVDVDSQSYNRYGQMETYDNIGLIHLRQGNSAQALSAFRLGLAIAEQISYRENYFNRRIRSITNAPKPGKIPVL